MLKKILLLAPVYFLFVFAECQDSLAIVNKATILSASEAELKEARQRTENLLKDVSNAEPLFGQFLIIGASLWDKIKDLPEFKNPELTNVIFKLPVLDANGQQVSKKDVTGKAIQDPEVHILLWKNLYLLFDLGKAVVTEMTTKDKFIYWLYFAKIEEPIIMVNSEKGRLLLKTVQGKLFFVEAIN